VSLDIHRINWAESARLRKAAQPMISVDAVVLAFVVVAVVFVGAFLLGYSDGMADAAMVARAAP